MIIGIESENLPKLLSLYMTIPEVVQVRCNFVIRQYYKDLVGDEGLYIACLVQYKDGSDKYIKFEHILPKNEWDNPNSYSTLLASMKSKIDDYLYKDILPKTPYSD